MSSMTNYLLVKVFCACINAMSGVQLDRPATCIDLLSVLSVGGYSKWSKGQLRPAYNRNMWHASWKRTRSTTPSQKLESDGSPRCRPAKGFGSILKVVVQEGHMLNIAIVRLRKNRR